MISIYPVGILRYVYLGSLVNQLQNPPSEISVSRTLGMIEHFYDHLDELNLKVTKRAAHKLVDFYNLLQEVDDASSLNEDGANRLSAIMSLLLETFDAEAQANLAYLVTDKRLDTNRLLNDISALLAPSVFDSLPSIAQYDITEAGKCIAYELPTSAAFHLLRGTEAVLRHFYLCYVKRNRIKSQMWGPVVEALRKCKTPPPTPLTDNLDNIRKSFRNPTQHPDKIYDIQEVQDLFGLCVDVINRMVNHEKWVEPYLL